MKRFLIVLIAMFILAGCTSFQETLTDTSIGAYAYSFDDVSKFSKVYGMWKDNVDTLYIQAGNDEYTNTYLLETLPGNYATIIKSLNKYDMKAYALLDSNVWLTESEQTRDEIRNILNYNRNYKDERFKGVNVSTDLQSVTNENFEVFLDNLKEARKLIDIHNDSAGDNLKLSINVNKELLDNDKFDDLVSVVDEVIYENKEDSIEDVERLLSKMVEHDNSVVVVADVGEEFFNNDYIDILKDVVNKLSYFERYESFNGFIINDYDGYHNFLGEQKRP